MLKIKIQKTDDDYALMLDGDVEDVSCASKSLMSLVPPECVTGDGLLRVRADAEHYLDAWLNAVQATNRMTRVTWLPVATEA